MTKRLLRPILVAIASAAIFLFAAMLFLTDGTQAQLGTAGTSSGSAVAQSTSVANLHQPDGTWADIANFPNITINYYCNNCTTPTPTSVPMKLKRAGAAAYPSNGKAYVLGGRHGVDGEDFPLRWIWEYTPGSPGNWVRKNALLDADLYGSRFTANMAVAALTDANGPRIYAFGGNSLDSIPTATTRIYDPTSDSLSTTDPWPASPARVPGGWAVHDNKLYIFGGFSISPTPQVFTDTWRFDPMAASGARWTQLPSANLSMGRAFIAGAALDGYIYAIGGDVLSGSNLTPVTIVERMDPTQASPTWTTVASLPSARGDMGAWAYDTGSGYEISGRIVVAGGIYPNPDAMAYSYDPIANVWSSFPSMLRATRNYGYAQLNGYLYAFGGYDLSGGTYSGSNLSQRYDATGPAMTPSPIVSTTATQTAMATATTCASNSNYAVSTAITTFVNTGTLIPGTQCQSCVIPFNLPFPVQFYDRTFTQANLSAHGNMQFLSASTSDLNRCLPWNGMNYAIMPFWDLGTTQSGGQGIFSQVNGTAGSRTLTIQWRNTGGSFEVRFFENSRDIEFVYGTVTGGGSSATIGLQKDTGSLFLQHSCNTASVSSGTRLIFTMPACNVATVTGTPPTSTSTATRTNTAAVTNTNTAVNTATSTRTTTRTSTAVASATNSPVVATATCVPAGSTQDVSIASFSYTPQNMTIPAGTTVRWTNTEGSHTSTSDTAVWDSGVLAVGGQFSYTFNTPGTYPYHCTLHPTMMGTITVQAGGLCATSTSVPSATRTNTPVAPSATATRTNTIVPTNTRIGTPVFPTATSTPSPTSEPPTSTATSTLVPTATSTACTITFTDVDETNPFYTWIRCLACRGILGGYNDGTFRPFNDITRGQIAKVVSNAAGFDEDPGAQIYEDVDANNPFYQWINRLSMRGHMGGYPCGTMDLEPCIEPGNRPYFRPFNNATRGQLAKIVANAAGLDTTPTGVFYTDVQEDHPFYTWIMRLTELGVMSGYECGGPGEPCDSENRPYFRPFNNVTRGQASKIVANTFFPDCQVR